jgi:uncharacterized membrane protein SpoIIM required for sporulation
MGLPTPFYYHAFIVAGSAAAVAEQEIYGFTSAIMIFPHNIINNPTGF